MTLKEALTKAKTRILFDVGTKVNRETGVSKRGKYLKLVIERTSDGDFAIVKATSKGYNNMSEWLINRFQNEITVLTDEDVDYLDAFADSQPGYNISYVEAT